LREAVDGKLASTPEFNSIDRHFSFARHQFCLIWYLACRCGHFYALFGVRAGAVDGLVT
jgi:hypothetical protein